MKTNHRAILQNEQSKASEPETPRVRQSCPSCSGRGEVLDTDPYADRRGKVACKPCKGTGYIAALIALLVLTFCNAHAATVTGTILNRQGGATSTNILFKSIQRPLVDFTPSIRPGWTVETNSASDGTFSTRLFSGNYQVTVGGDSKDTYLIEVPTNDAVYDITLLITNVARYRYTGAQEFTNFVATLNGATFAAQTLGTGTNGSDFSVITSGAAHTFNLPPASATKTGKLLSTDFADFAARVTQAQLTAASNVIQIALALRASTTDLLGASNVLAAADALKATTASLLAASNVLATATALKASTTDLLGASNTLATSVALKAATTDLLGASNALVTAISLKSSTLDLLGASNALRADLLLTATLTQLSSASNLLYRTGTNLTTESSARFGLWKQTTSSGRMEFYGLEQGSNIVIYFNGSNIVLNGVGSTVVAASTFDSTSGTFDSSTLTFDSQ